MNQTTVKSLFVFGVMALIMNLCSPKAHAEKKIGMILFSEENRYNEARRGVVDQLKEAGFEEPAVKYRIENAGGNKAKAIEIAQKFSAERYDLIVTLGTNATTAAAKTTTNIPIVFTMVYDPVEAGIAKSWWSSGNNTTGSSTRVPMAKLLKSLKDFAPVTSLAVLYAPGEKQTEIQLQELQKVQSEFQIKIVPVMLTKEEEVNQALPKIMRTVDAISFPGGSVAGKYVAKIVNMATKANVITISHLDDMVDKGVLLGVCVNSYQIGRLAGTKAAAILKGAQPSSIPIEPPTKLDIVLNMKTAKAGQYRIPPKYMSTVTRTIE